MFRTTLTIMSLVFIASCATTPQITPAVRADLAPTGKLRAGINYGNPQFATRDPRTGEGSGIAVDLAREFGRRLGVPVELVGYNSGGQLTAGLKAGGWDVAILAFAEGRTNEISFSAPFAEIDGTYLVPPGSPLRTAADVDRNSLFKSLYHVTPHHITLHHVTQYQVRGSAFRPHLGSMPASRTSFVNV